MHLGLHEETNVAGRLSSASSKMLDAVAPEAAERVSRTSFINLSQDRPHPVNVRVEQAYLVFHA